MNVKKYGCLTLLAALMLALGCAGVAHAEIIPPDPWGTQIGYPCVVLCETLTLREGPSASAKAIQTLHYGDRLCVQDADASGWTAENNGFVYCILGELEGSPCGWADSDYILFNPVWYVTETETPVYAWNDPSAPKVALLDKNAKLPILKEEDGWYIVSLRGATGWIQK